MLAVLGMAGMSETVSAQAGTMAWTLISTANNDLAAPSLSTQQTAALVLDIDGDGVNDFVVGARQEPGPSLVWYRRHAGGWTRYVIEPAVLNIEAGGAYHDIDGDGDLDIVMGGDSTSNEVWWWENPAPAFDPDTPWTRRSIKRDGGSKHHDAVFGDFDQDGQAELVFWNQGARTLYLAEIPADPHVTDEWARTPIYQWQGREHEGLVAYDVDQDGAVDIVGGGRWFKYDGAGTFARSGRRRPTIHACRRGAIRPWRSCRDRVGRRRRPGTTHVLPVGRHTVAGSAISWVKRSFTAIVLPPAT